jgi:coenzyme F420-reducing hydrogenase alpha subunit
MKFSLTSLALLGLAAIPLRADVSQREMNYGYGLLHHLCDQETQVDLIMMVKTTPPDVAQLAKEVSKSAKEDMSILGDLADHDPAIHFGEQGLPEIETETRASIKDEKQHLLLFGTKGGDFAKTLVLTQIEASTYGENMAKVLANDETNPHRAEALRHIASHWETIKNKSYALLYRL